MAENDRTWARLVDAARSTYPDELDLAALHAREAYEEEETAAYAAQAAQLDLDAFATEAEVAAAQAEGRAYVLTLQHAGTPATLAGLQGELAAARAELASARADIAAERADLAASAAHQPQAPVVGVVIRDDEIGRAHV